MSNDDKTNIVDFPVQLDPAEIITADGNTLTTTSLQVAEVFSKRHDNVLSGVEKLNCSNEFRLLNFKVCSKNNELQNGKPQKYYEITKDGFMFLVMGYTGKKAAQIKEAYINAFNFMAEKLFGLKAKLTPEEQRQIQDAVNAKLADCDQETKKRAYPEVYGRIKRKFRVGKYDDILSIHFHEVLDYIERMEVKRLEHKKEVSMIALDGSYYALCRDGKITLTPMEEGCFLTTMDRLPLLMEEKALITQTKVLKQIALICMDRIAKRAEKEEGAA